MATMVEARAPKTAPPPEAVSSGWRKPHGDCVHIFESDPDLLSGVDPASADFLRRRVVAPRLWIEPGGWTPPADLQERAPFGLLVLDGLLVRSVSLEDRECPELIGAGDLVRPWAGRAENGLVPCRTSWSALERTTVAILDERFAAVAARCPSVLSALLARSVERSHGLALHLAIAHVRHAELRLSMLLWHLADRWGKVTPAGVHVPLVLTHELLAHLSCMRRPTASSALQRLVRAGEIARRPDGTWLLLGDPPQEAGPEPDPVAA